MNNLITRTVSGIIIVLIVIGSLILAEYSFLGLILVIYSLGLYEFKTMFRLKSQSVFYIFLVIGQADMIFYYLYLAGRASFDLFLSSVNATPLIIITLFLFLRQAKTSDLVHYLTALIWLAGSLVFFMSLGWKSETGGYSARYPMILIVMIWIYDVGAYFFGSLAGKKPLSPEISPGKSLEGFISGILITMAAGYGIFKISGDLSGLTWILIGLIISLSSTAGDLFESKLKRVAGVKDSGQLIPGHGGILDRFDSMLVAAPAFYITIQVIHSL